MSIVNDPNNTLNTLAGADLIETDEYIFEDETSPVSWCAIAAGAVVAIVVSLGLLLLGSSLGFAVASPFTELDASVTAITAGMIGWLIFMQWVSAGFGGYIAGRLRSKWSNVDADETFFRDTAHGLITWAVATLITVTFLTSTVSSIIGGATEAATTVAAGAVAGDKTDGDTDQSVDYYVDSLLRSGNIDATAAANNPNAEIARIFAVGLKNDGLSADDKNYLVDLVSARTGLSESEANRRVETIYGELDQAKDEAKKAADKASKAAATFAIFAFLSMLVGAFIACVAAALGGRHLYED